MGVPADVEAPAGVGAPHGMGAPAGGVAVKWTLPSQAAGPLQPPGLELLLDSSYCLLTDWITKKSVDLVFLTASVPTFYKMYGVFFIPLHGRQFEGL